jgi:hypothetical protein
MISATRKVASIVGVYGHAKEVQGGNETNSDSYASLSAVTLDHTVPG